MKKLIAVIKFSWFYNLKTTWKLTIILGILSLAGIGVGIYSSIAINTLGKETNSLFFTNVQAIMEVNYTKLDINEMQYNLTNIVTRGDTKAVGMVERNLPRLDTRVDTLKKRAKVDSAEYFAETWEEVKPRLESFCKNPEPYVGTPQGRSLSQSVLKLWQDVLLVETDLQTVGVNELKTAIVTAQKKSVATRNIVLIMLVVAFSLGFITIRSISQPLYHLRKAMLGLAEGNLQMPTMPSATQDDIGETAKAYEDSVNKLRDMISRVSEVTSSLTTIVSELSPQIAATGAAADIVSQTMNELARGTQEQARAADEVASTIHSVVEQIDRTGQKTKVIAEYSTTVIAEARQGEEDTQTILRHINDLSDSSNKATTVIQSLQERSVQIETIVGKIREITEQTQLLALNASIEAARAGEYGRGFGVVAHEVGKLAEKSAQSVHDVEDVLGSIQEMVLNAVQVMEESVNQASQGRRVITETSERFNQIFASINKVAAEIQTVAIETSNLSQANQRVLEEIDTIAAISEQTAANTEEVMATVENQAGSVTQVAEAMKKLNDCSQELDVSVNRFYL